MLKKISYAFLCSMVVVSPIAWSADVVLQGDESVLFIRETDELKLIEFVGSIISRTDVTGLTCDTSASAVAIIGTEAEVSRYIAMMLTSQASNIPVRIFINSGFGAGQLCTVDTIRMGFLPL